MWSDRPSPACRRQLADALRRVLPSPREGARSFALEMDGNPDPAALVQSLWSDPGFVWLDSPHHAELGIAPLARLPVTNGLATISSASEKVQIPARGFDLVEAALDVWGGQGEARLYGYLGYELGSELENVPRAPLEPDAPPDLQLALYDWRFEHSGEGWVLRGTDAWRQPPDRKFVLAGNAAGASPPERTMTAAPPGEGFQAAVARTVDRIYAGELFQVNLCRRLEAPFTAEETLPLYLRLRAISPADYGALIRTEAGGVLSVSPELFLSVRDGCVRTRPIKGTRPRGATPAEDRALATALACSEKDRAELAMIVDVARNDLGRVCRPGSVKVGRHAKLMALPTVHHTYTEVTGRLRPECGPADLLRAGFPPASITGAPKIHAMELAALEEGFRRGPCMGSIGWISLTGDIELSVGIRTAVAAPTRIWYLAGCGITMDSVPEEELAESEAKAAAFRRAFLPSAPSSRPGAESH